MIAIAAAGFATGTLRWFMVGSHLSDWFGKGQCINLRLDLLIRQIGAHAASRHTKPVATFIGACLSVNGDREFVNNGSFEHDGRKS